MQSLVFLWFQLQTTKQYLREKTFGPAQSPTSAFPSQNLPQLTGSRVWQVRQQPAQKAEKPLGPLIN
jgi:hypothetical protein